MKQNENQSQIREIVRENHVVKFPELKPVFSKNNSGKQRYQNNRDTFFVEVNGGDDYSRKYQRNSQINNIGRNAGSKDFYIIHV